MPNRLANTFTRWWNSLSIQIKLHLLIQVSMLIILLMAQRWLMSSFENQIQLAAESRAIEAADGVINGMNMLMLTGKISDPANRKLFIKKMGQSKGIRELRIIRADQVTRQFGPGLPEEQPIDSIDRMVLETKQVYLKNSQDMSFPTLRVVVPFVVSQNFRGTNCLMCHNVQVGSVNGAASIMLDLSEEEAQIRNINLWLWIGQIGLQIVLFVVIGILVRSLTTPLRSLQEVMTAMQADGDLSRRVEIAGDDEIGQMGSAFNALATSLQTSVDQVSDYAKVVSNTLTDFKESEQRFRQLAENIKQIFWMTDAAKTKMLYISPAYEEIWGASCESLYRDPKSFIDRIHPDDRERVISATALQVAGGYDETFRIVRDGGEIRWIRDRAFPVFDESGKPIRIAGIAEDITSQKQAEEQLKLSAKVFLNSLEAIVITDANNIIVNVNRAFSDITGYSPDEVIGKNPRVMKSNRQDPAFYREMWETLLSTGSWQGEIWDRRKSGEIYPKWLSLSVVRDDEGRISNYIGLFSDITERKASFERIEHLAHYDALTLLPNRTLLNDRLESAIAAAKRHRQQVALLFLDLDRFKIINDSLGHFAGDELLKSVAVRLKSCVRETDTVARLGGDEFIIVLTSVQELSDAAHVALKVLEVMAESFIIDNHELNISPSIGISVYPFDGEDYSALIKNADAAMYHAKDKGRNNFQFFTPDMNARAYERLSIESDLRRALKKEEFFVQYQPQLDLMTGQIIGMEALIRWKHPERGLISPDRFIPLAEDCGLIVSIGDWVLRTACEQNREWQKAKLISVPVAVNLSALQFNQKNLPQTIERILEETGLNPAYLEVELTERVVMQDAAATIVTLHALKEMGIGLSIDDFGTGYSSLSYLKRFPIDKLKVDRSFVRDITEDPDDAMITQTVITMGHSLRMKVIAEGVETAEQLAFLKEQGCDEIQGYFLSKPLSAPDFAEFLKHRSAVPSAV